MRTSSLIVGLCFSVLVFACGGDDESLPDAAGQIPDAPIANPDAATNPDAPPATIDADQAPDATQAAVDFCALYETRCGFDDQTATRYDDSAACITAYENYSPGRVSCVETHLGLASGDPTLHCPHATGMAPCN